MLPEQECGSLYHIFIAKIIKSFQKTNFYSSLFRDFEDESISVGLGYDEKRRWDGKNFNWVIVQDSSQINLVIHKLRKIDSSSTIKQNYQEINL